jgi:hypothetical protein
MAHAQVATGQYRQMAGWSGLLVSGLLLAWLFNAGVINATGGVRQIPPTVTVPAQVVLNAHYEQSGIHEGTNRQLSPATAALADGDDVRAGVLADPPAATCTTQPLYAGRTSWVPLYARCTDALP